MHGSEFYELLGKTEAQLRSHPSADQVIVVKTAKSNLYCLSNHVRNGVYDEEDGFVQMLSDRGDAEIKFLVCMWSSGELDVPSMHFRKKLLSACPKNGEALILLQSDRERTARKLMDCI